MKKKYIDAEGLNEWLDSWQDAERTAFKELRKKEENSTEAQQQFLKGAQYAERCYFEATRAYIEHMPAADVMEVKRGKWIIENAGGGWKRAICPHCLTVFLYAKGHYQIGIAPYCPACGAMMDGGGEE